ncbi:MAG: hypothetical protein ACOVN7_02835, partial [Rubrivivax sp.]
MTSQDHDPTPGLGGSPHELKERHDAKTEIAFREKIMNKMHQLLRDLASILCAVFVAACGGGSGTTAADPPPQPPVNRAPLANAGAAQTVTVGTSVTL